MTQIDRVNNVLAYLYDHWTVVLKDLEADVYDGPPAVALGNRGITIAWAPDELGVTTEDEPGGLTDDRVRFNINCGCWARIGDTDTTEARAQVAEQLNAIEADLSHDPRLGRRVTRAKLRFMDLEQYNNEDGTWAFVVFTITCDAFH